MTGNLARPRDLPRNFCAGVALKRRLTRCCSLSQADDARNGRRRTMTNDSSTFRHHATQRKNGEMGLRYQLLFLRHGYIRKFEETLHIRSRSGNSAHIYVSCILLKMMYADGNAGCMESCEGAPRTSFILVFCKSIVRCWTLEQERLQ